LFRSPDSALSLVKVVLLYFVYYNSFLFWHFLVSDQVLDWWFWMLIVRGNLVCVIAGRLSFFNFKSHWTVEELWSKYDGQ
jgi:hypothetical protein